MMQKNTTKLRKRMSMAHILAGAMLTAGIGCAASAEAGPFVLAYTDGQDPQSYTNLQSFHSNLSAVGLGAAYGILANGTIDTSGLNSTITNTIAYAKANNIAVYPTVSDYSNAIGGFDPNISVTIGKTATSRANAVTNLVNLATANGFAGINLDMEAVGQESGGPTATDTSNFTAFVTALASALHAKGLKLIESIPASNGTSGYAWLNGYNYAALGAQVDYLQVMTYDEVGPGWSGSTSGTWPGPCSGLDWMNSVMTYTVSVVSPAKILLGLPTYGYDFSTANQQTWAADSSKGTPGFAAYISAKKGTNYLDSASSTPYANWGTVKQQAGSWSSSTAQPSLWYDNPASITAKAALVPKYKLGGTGVWAMGYEDANFWNAHNAGIGATGGGGGGGGGTSNIAPSGTGHIWTGMASATANTGEVSSTAVNDGNTTTSVTLNLNGEGGSAKWESAGVTWSTVHTISSVVFINGAIDNYGNGYFQSGLSMQYTTNGTTWVQSNWTVSPAYPNSSAAASKSYTFSGTALTGVTGVRVSGQTGSSSWSGSVMEVQAIGQ